MKPGLQAGAAYEFSVQVTEAMTARLEGREIHPFYGTTSMIAHMEWAARQHILPYLEPGEEGVGYHVEVRHLRPTPVGGTVTIRSTVSDVSADRVTSRVEAWSDSGPVGEGTLTQAIVPLEVLYDRGRGQREAVESAEEAVARKPSVLGSPAGEHSLTLWIEKRESHLACTRYDEWLTCRLILKGPDFYHTERGAFLLRYELEEWAESLLAGKPGRTDFLEAPFQCSLQKEAGDWHLTVDLYPPAVPGEPAPSRPLRTLQWVCPPDRLQGFAKQLLRQLSLFPSML